MSGVEPGGRVLERDGWRVRLAAHGTGPSALDGLAVTNGWRYPERHAGVVLYIRDPDRGTYWTTGLLPGAPGPEKYRAHVDGAVPRFVREDGGVETVTEVALAEGPTELRRVTLTNGTAEPRRLEITSFVPVVLDDPVAYATHPAFSKLFLQTEYVPALQGLLVRRRPRSPSDPPWSAAHLLVATDPADHPELETDRASFLGRGRGPARPLAMAPGAGPLSGTTGSVLDPVLALRRAVTIPAGESAVFTTVLGAGESRAAAREAVAPMGTPDAVRAAFEAAARDAYARTPGPDAGDPGPDRGAALLAALPGAGAGTVVREAEGGREEAAAQEEPGEGRGATAVADPADELRFFNGYGGFSADGREYVIRLGTGPDGLDLPPHPWINVIANETVGFLVSERGAGYTWAGNSRLNRLTPWHNDPVTDPHGEAVYLRDDESGAYWSPVPGPAPGPGPYETRHGFGYSRHHHESGGLEQDVWQFVAPDAPVKLIRVRVANRSGRRRRLTVYGYFEWVLGSGEDARSRVEAAPDGHVVLARNRHTEDHADAVAFATAVGGAGARGATASRAAFMGTGSPTGPAAVRSGERPEPEAASGDGSCAAPWVELTVEPGGVAECAFLLGQAESEARARELMERFGTPDRVTEALEGARSRWRELLDGIRVETPVPALDLLVNGWLPYQNLSCRIYGRSALYQSGGAYGYRDQLQDVAGLIHLEPALARAQILRHARHQFPEGDVLHWWHPPASRGIRTRFSDDLLWLPYVTAFYLDVTGDAGVLEERVPFVVGRPLEPGEDEVYMTPARSPEDATVYEHACRAIDRSLTRGPHGLPLIGTGDWNDGMNRVGREGTGESVWLGFFLVAILDRWIPLCEARGDDRAERYRAYREELERALNHGDGGWDGAWYRRAYYDTGAPLGSTDSRECRIDAIAQAWSVLSGVATPARARQALDSLEEHLVDEEHGLIRLLTPPFDETPHDPGYIKGYLPGVRENGGQYTHGVLWAVRAMAELGRADRAAELLEMILPVSHARTRADADRYRVEPYVVAADVYGAEPYMGRGGWTWYTGSAGWMYRVALESILGLTIEAGRRLRIRPTLPSSWPGFSLRYRVPEAGTRYEIDVRRVDGASRATLDGEPVGVSETGVTVPLSDDGGVHQLRVELGPEGGVSYRRTDP